MSSMGRASITSERKAPGQALQVEIGDGPRLHRRLSRIPSVGNNATASRSPSGYGRPSLLAQNLGLTNGLALIDRRGSDAMSTTEETDVPSPTASRLRSLARSVRAAQKLGTLKVRNKYLVSAPMPAAGSVTSSGSKDQETSSKLPSTRVIMLSTHEFSTSEMKFRLDPLDVVKNASAAQELSMLTNASASANGAMNGVGTARSVSSTKGVGKARWKQAYNKALQPTPEASNGNNNSNEATNFTTGSGGYSSPLRAHLNGGNSKSAKRTGSINMDYNSLMSSETPDTRNELSSNLEARLCCARSLYKLSCRKHSELAIIRGGAIRQIADISDVDNSKLHELCAATLANLTSDPDAVDAFVAQDGIPAILELIWLPSVFVKIMCATALCRLSLSAPHAATLAKAKATVEFLSIMSLPSEHLQTLAISCIVNMVFYGHEFADRIFLGEPHAVQNQLGIMSITRKLANAPPTIYFATEVLYNLAIHRGSCSGALRGGGAEILYEITSNVCRILDDHSATSRNLLSPQTPTPRMTSSSTITLLRLVGETLANFSAQVEFHTTMSVHATKTLVSLLVGALRDLGSRLHGAAAEERLRALAVPCSRALVNFSSSDDIRRHFFTQEVIQLTTRLFLVNTSHWFPNSLAKDAEAYARNMLRTICNLSFCEMCTALVMEFPDVMARLSKLILLSAADDSSSEESSDESEEDDEERDARRLKSLTTDSQVGEDIKEDALVTVLNLALQGPYSNELLKAINGKLLSQAAEHPGHSRRLKYIYTVVLCNLLFETRLQQVVYGDIVINALVDGFYFFSSSSAYDAFDNDSGSPEALLFKSAKLAFSDDQERFLAAICTIAGELLDARNIDRLVTVCLECLQTPIVSSQRTRRRPITCYAAAILYTLARSSAQRGDTANRVYSSETEATLISVCERAGGNGGSNETGSCAFCAHTQAFCAATLYQICASGHFNSRVIQALITTCNSNEESISLLACAASFAIISFTTEGRHQLVSSANLATALNRLGRTSQVECQQYAAIAACNVSTLRCVWTSVELKDFIVVALLRANSIQAKQIHAKTLTNLLSHAKTRPKAVEDGVLYALMKLSQVMLSASGANDEDPFSLPGATVRNSNNSKQDPTGEVFSLGLQVLFNLSCEHQYHQKLLGNGVMAYLVMAINGKQTSASSSTGTTSNLGIRPAAPAPETQSTPNPLASSMSSEGRRFAMGIICNLSSYEENHKELMNAQVTEVIRSYVDHDIEARASAAMALRNLSCRQPWVEMICERRTLHMLIVFTQCEHPVVKHFAIQALANCSLVADSLHLFVELRVPRAVLTLLESMKAASLMKPAALATSISLEDASETNMAALKCLHNIAFDDLLAQNLTEENAVLRLHSLLETQELGHREDACTLAASMVSILAGKAHCAEHLLRQRIVSFCALLHRKHPTNVDIAHECAAILMKLSTYQQIQSSLAETQAIQVIVSICSSSAPLVNPRIRERGAIMIRNLTLCVTEHLSVFYDDTFEDVPSKSKRKTSKNYESRTNPHDDIKVSRLTERHLLLGVKYYQGEIEKYSENIIRHKKDHSSFDRVLIEASAAFSNMSTISDLRVAMVLNGVIKTLLQIFDICQQSLTLPAIVKSICSSTLHRLAMEREATVDGQDLFVPGLLEILHQTDEELHQVRYECEKVSFLVHQTPRVRSSTALGFAAAAKLPTKVNFSGESNSKISRRFSSGRTSPRGKNGSMACVKQSYREPKWVVYVVKAMLSSSTMVPQLEKKQIRSLGLPKLSFSDQPAVKSTNVNETDLSSDELKQNKGYLLPIHWDKFTKHLPECVDPDDDDGISEAPASLSSRSSPSAVVRESHDLESVVHSLKFDRHMRLTRRNYRRNPVHGGAALLSFV
ncbi:hypothetical protein Poli38472_002559 [Pythium oligandrum]|uniref:Vacuolar protein 8 n=1 Tax=Pythium oligandrum TaxID=41045 RepID=A0A8K1CIK4_PYTOL|nr:hypothetical protein Poli38472_002559 [Pythium oligandrum]|eukprot:TMW63618.1 hypothetical protein Poli38472_002559 [Pythium oligandrum]